MLRSLNNQLLLAKTLFFVLMHIKLAHCMAEDYCYADIGCFPLSDEFYHPRHRPFNVRPWHRSRIRIHFELYSNAHHREGFILRPWDKLNLIASRFDPMLETKIIVPGWLDNIKRALWVRRLKDALLWRWRPVNIIVVHWRNFTPYTIATANTRVVGAELANLLRFIEHELKYDRSYYHLIGHSLGAHISGYCGDRMAGLGRITALDPARPFFQHMPKSVRLDRGDAKFVDAIHSDFTPENAIFLLMSFGMTTPVGHVDFYPNGPPLLQPGCLRDSLLSVRNGIQRGLEHNSLAIAFLEALRYLTACDHQRSHEWFIESITNRECVFVGVRCNDFDGLINGQCNCDNSPSACAIMGIHADQMYLNNVHEDLWPLRQGRARPAHLSPLTRPSAAPALAKGQLSLDYQAPYGPRQQLSRPVTREQVYAQMKKHASSLRQPSVPSMPSLLDDKSFLNELEGIQDEVLVEHLRNNFFGQLTKPPSPPPPKDGTRDALNIMFLNNGPQALSEHPKLLSDLDRDIEQWYEGTSRWYLKTNNKANYCANQYQVLVYLGPLKSTTGHRHIRANLIVSIIGSRGQLMNQRFIPRSSKLDSFTMQPFFILLEGSYSLGNILSVAIGWEARVNPDPIQATVSFQSNLLESIQSFWPTYHAKHPWLSATLKYDHSPGFQWHHQDSGFGANELLSQALGVHLERRSTSKDLSIDKRSLYDESAVDGEPLEQLRCSADNDHVCLPSEFYDSPGELALPENNNRIDEDMLIDKSGPQDVKKSLNVPNELGTNYDADLETLATSPSLLVPGGLDIPELHLGQPSGEIGKIGGPQLPVASAAEHFHKSFTVNELLEEPSYTTEITAKLHNIGVHLDRDSEDSIVISQVVVNPLQARYGQRGTKNGKTFCPPHSNYKLRRDQTVRLEPNLVGKCIFQNS